MATFEIKNSKEVLVKNDKSQLLLSLKSMTDPDGSEHVLLTAYSITGNILYENSLLRSTLLDAIVHMWPENVAYKFPRRG